MNGNNSDNNHFELITRRHSSRDVPLANVRDQLASAGSDLNTKRYSLSTGIGGAAGAADDNMSASISILSGSRSTVARTPSNLSTKSKQQRRKKSSTGSSDVTDSSSKANRNNKRNALTSSFLRRKRIEYTGTIRKNLIRFFSLINWFVERFERFNNKNDGFHLSFTIGPNVDFLATN